MNLKEFFNSKVSFFNSDLKTKNEVIDFLSQQLADNKFVKDIDEFKKTILKRESQDSTGIGDAIAIPHAITDAVDKSCIAFMSLKNPIDWNSIDGKPVDLVFMIATNDVAGDEHLTAISNLSIILMNSEKQKGIKKAKNFKEFIKNFEEETTKKEVVASNDGHFDVVGITACPTGIAHTYLAAEKLNEYAKSLGMTVKIETQGRRGTEDRLTQDDIDNAKVIILAHDKTITGMGRFNGKQAIDTSTKDAIFNGTTLIQEFSAKAKAIKASSNETGEDDGDFSLKKFKDIKGNLLGGVSRMLPFVVAGGIILGLGFLIDSLAGATGGSLGVTNEFAGMLSAIGKTAMFMMVPILGGYIAYSIVGPQGLMPGIIAGMISDGSGGFLWGKYDGEANAWGALWSRILPGNIPTTSGFIGAMVGGYIAAFIVYGLTIGMRNMSKSFQGVRDIVFIPFLSLVGIAIAMFALSIPLGYTMQGLQDGLKWLVENKLIIIAAGIVGLMMCVDMGGPINKIAYVTGTLTVAGDISVIVDGNNQATVIMAAAMAAGMIPPLGVALCSVLFKSVWTQKERDAAKANWLMGAFFITEGAIPFMVTDPKRISISAMAGGLISGLIVGGLNIGLNAPHGGVVVFPLLKSFLFDGNLGIAMGILFYIFAIVIGVLVMTFILGFWKLADIKNGKLTVDSGITKKVKLAK
ncbi:PTS system, fructose-specific IIABC component [Spiroplasma sp. TIUS-1]|uniref:PTS fructose transporter subunit IIABC n=1 Tax=Spiroplasma sp. TIUS-1 TaxID=216963 RepID=UPI0013991201|nr:fructose-specific PTS transporter subunit EIIC [Spiroplasma sp. TIUS-1]QHX35945.1 PTS system, fructose-specific IIABC component [Spiroplasma sp. TIUS-1]